MWTISPMILLYTGECQVVKATKDKPVNLKWVKSIEIRHFKDFSKSWNFHSF